MGTPDDIDVQFLEAKPGSVTYKSALDRWYEDSSVRASPQAIFPPNEKGLFFSPALAPLWDLLPKESGIRDSYLAHKICSYLWFTSELEHQIVNEVTRSIALGRYEVPLSYDMRRDAFRIYCDEAYHALSSFDAVSILAEQGGVSQSFLHAIKAAPRFIRLHQEISTHHAQTYVACKFAMATVSETLITGNLNVIPRDERVKQSIRDLVGDHARDESRHHRFFTNVAPIIWQSFDESSRSAISENLPDWICAFLVSDIPLEIEILSRLDDPRIDMPLLLSELVSTEGLDSILSKPSKSTRRLFSRLGHRVSPASLIEHARKVWRNH